MLTPANKLPNIDCNTPEVQKILDVQPKSRPSSPNPTYADNMTSMDIDNLNQFTDIEDATQKVCQRFTKTEKGKTNRGRQKREKKQKRKTKKGKT